MREIEISIIWRKVFVLMSLQWQISFSDGVVTADFAEIAKKSAATRPARVRVTLTLTLALSHCTQPIQSPWDVTPSSQYGVFPRNHRRRAQTRAVTRMSVRLEKTRTVALLTDVDLAHIAAGTALCNRHPTWREFAAYAATSNRCFSTKLAPARK